MNEPILEIQHVCKDYEGGVIKALRGVTMQMHKGEVVALMGPSGCGKSTLLSLIGLLDQPTSGSVLYRGRDLAREPKPFRYRNQVVGFVFQFHHLIPTMTLAENVACPLVSLGMPRGQRQLRALEFLGRMGLEQRAGALPNRVSGGERQRAAVARALVHQPELVLADEPTGNLDSTNSMLVTELLLNLARQSGTAVLLASHNPEIAGRCDRLIELRDGAVLT